MNITKRISKFLLIAALAVPAWTSLSAQNRAVPPEEAPAENQVREKAKDLKGLSVATRNAESRPVGKSVSINASNAPEPQPNTVKPIARMASRIGNSAPTLKAPMRADAETVTPPASATYETWNISTAWYYYTGSAWSQYDYNTTSVQVAFDGNDVYIQGLCYWIPNAWVKGTMNSSQTQVTFPKNQYYGILVQNNVERPMWFVGLNSSNEVIDEVVFAYDKNNHKLTLSSGTRIFDASGANSTEGYAYHTGTVISKPAETVTVADGTDTGKVPVYLYALDYYNHGQIIYPADDLNLTQGSKIKSITFYANSALTGSNSSGYNNSVTIKVGETQNTTTYGTSTDFITGLTTVATMRNILTGDASVTFTFNEPYEYQGGNLVIDATTPNWTYSTYSGTYSYNCTAQSVKWFGQNSSGSSLLYCSDSNGGNSSTAAGTQQNFLPKMTLVVDKAENSSTTELDFGTVNVESSPKTLSAYIANDSDNPVTAAVTVEPNPPFSVASTEVTLAANTLTSIPVTFTPSEARNYNGTLTVVAGDVTTTIPLKGAGHTDGPGAIRDEAFFEGIEYNWTDSVGTTHTSKLNEIATDPDQIIAMLKEVYTNKTIPGNFKRGYTENGSDNDRFNVVTYTGVGKVNSSGQYVDSYGWNIPGTVKSGTVSGSSGSSYTYYYMQEDQYKPDDEGVTLLLLEIVDDFDATKVDTNGDPTHDYAGLRGYFKKAIKSARVVTEAKRVGDKSDYSSATLFKIDCNKMNKFYLIAKGQLGWLQQRYQNIKSTAAEDDDYYDFYGYPMYLSYDNSYLDIGLHSNYLDVEPAFLCHMFEQLSPAEGNSTAPLTDGYQMFVTEMKSFGIIHDCPNVPFVLGKGHHFMMYGQDSPSNDCQDIRDMMFLVPDYRMMNWTGRGSDSSTSTSTDGRRQDYFYYNTSHQPKIGVFVIHQNAITGAQTAYNGNENNYKLHLTWTSNLLDYLPDVDGQYDLYRVITNADGTKTYQKVGQFNPNTFAYDDNVPMQQTGQQVTYVVQGRDVDGFLSLQMSNEESFIIPGLDRAEQLRIDLNSDYYFSRYDAGEQKNYYSNSLIANNTVGTNVKPAYIENGSEFKFWRATVNTVNGQAVVDTANAVNFVKAVVSNYSQTGGGTLTYGSWVDQANFSSKPYGHGYHTNPTTSRIRIVSGEVVFDGLKLYDNFSVDVSENKHPAQYVYYVTLHTAVPFDLGDNSGSSVPAIATVQNGTYAYFEVPTSWTSYNTIRAWAWKRVYNGDTYNDVNLTGDTWPGSGVMQYVGTLSNNNNLYRWIAGETVTDMPTHLIFNGGWYDDSDYQTGTFDFVNGGYYTTSGLVGTSNTSQEARSNTVRVPVYKTEMEMKPITATQVEADIDHSVQAATEFDVDARYSSKSEILGYYIYRWADAKTAASARSIYDSQGEDESPQGQAGNQGEYYTVAMNTDYTAETEHFASDFADVTATFLDNFMNNEAEEADTYTYAPVVELFAPAEAVIISTGNDNGQDRDDYNTYGGPQQMTAGGLITIKPGTPVATADEFTAEVYGATTAPTCKYYYIPLTINVDVPNGYSIYKVRAWRQVDKQWLGEKQAQSSRVSNDYLFDTLDDAAEEVDVFIGNTTLGGAHNYKGLFGAKSLASDESFDANFIVRVYFTKPSKDGEARYYIAEKQQIVNVNSENIITGVVNVKGNKQVAGVKYYNLAGIESDQPFDGVNIVVTRYTDGSTSTTKVMK